ncbi:hypothetical protein L1049_009084 [Liquidambar formosana]|uniref:Glycosyltransferases n=1 Tax=Liquidambar formosana TaxID=63359 RepID=A0AAP0X9R5_LIQFO
MGSLERSSKKGSQLWKKAVVHFLLCFIMGFFTGFAPTGRPSSMFSAGTIAASNQSEFSPLPTPHAESSVNRSLIAQTPELVAVPVRSRATDSAAGDEKTLEQQEEENEAETLIPRRLIIIITPTSSKDRFQGVFLRRLANTLRLVRPPLLWIIVEAAQSEYSSEVSEILRKSGIMYRHLVFKENFTDVEAEMDHQRNVALKHVEHHRLSGIVHFAGLSNVYDLGFFDDIRDIEVFGTWPIASASGNRNKVIMEGPVCDSSQVIGWHLRKMKNQEDAVSALHISSFAFNSSILWDPERWGRPSSTKDQPQNSIKFVKQVVLEDETKLKGISPEGCSKIMLWDLHFPIGTTPSDHDHFPVTPLECFGFLDLLFLENLAISISGYCTNFLETSHVPTSLPPPEEVKLSEVEYEQSKHAYSVPVATEVEYEQSKHAYSVPVATAVATEAAASSAQTAAEVVRPTMVSQFMGKSGEEVAAIKFKRHSGDTWLQSLVQGPAVKRQATTTLRCMQTLSRVQSQIHARRIRMSEENQALQRQLLQKHAKELENLQMGEEWDDSLQSKEQIEANLLSKHEAAMKRERALAYAFSHQKTWKNSSRSSNPMFMDPTNPTWGWSWLERWMAARPWESRNLAEKELNNDHLSVKSASRSIAGGEISKAYARHQLNSDKQSPTASQKPNRPASRQSPSTPPTKAVSSSSMAGKLKPASPMGSIWGPDDDSKSMLSMQSEQHRRHSIGGPSVRDDESLASSPGSSKLYGTHKVSKS